MQWAYKYYQLAKFSNVLSAILGTLQLVMLFVFEPTWKFYIVYAIVWLVFGAGLYFGYNGVSFFSLIKKVAKTRNIKDNNWIVVTSYWTFFYDSVLCIENL